MSTRVGFIGLGNIGKPMAVNVAHGGFDLMVHDLRPEPVRELAALGAKAAASPLDIGRHAEIVELVVMNDAQVEEVTLGPQGVFQTMAKGGVVAIHSTVHPDTVKKVFEAGKTRGIGVFDAQVSGGEKGAAARTLAYMVGGDKALLERCRPLFNTSAGNIFHLGPLGSGASAKIAHNMIVYVNYLAAAEGMRLAKKLGIDLDAFEALVRVSGGQSNAMNTWQERRRRWDADPRPDRLPALYYKDLALALSMAHDAGVAVPGAALAQQQIDMILHW
ncbi:MAG: NAD(P)-dependent oxidoreductase [Betaproteobacteria bacterium]|nr:NAD(P)-dependent oxidoreductase [Betaproteobacteria bacterium]